MTTKVFLCTECRAMGKIIIKNEDYDEQDIAYCPVCGASIYEESDDFVDD